MGSEELAELKEEYLRTVKDIKEWLIGIFLLAAITIASPGAEEIVSLNLYTARNALLNYWPEYKSFESYPFAVTGVVLTLYIAIVFTGLKDVKISRLTRYIFVKCARLSAFLGSFICAWVGLLGMISEGLRLGYFAIPFACFLLNVIFGVLQDSALSADVKLDLYLAFAAEARRHSIRGKKGRAWVSCLVVFLNSVLISGVAGIFLGEFNFFLVFVVVLLLSSVVAWLVFRFRLIRLYRSSGESVLALGMVLNIILLVVTSTMKISSELNLRSLVPIGCVSMLFLLTCLERKLGLFIYFQRRYVLSAGVMNIKSARIIEKRLRGIDKLDNKALRVAAEGSEHAGDLGREESSKLSGVGPWRGFLISLLSLLSSDQK